MFSKKLGMVFIVLICLLVGSSMGWAAEEGVTVGKVMPQFTLSNLAGDSITVASAGKVTIINFWASWCPPCRSEMPELNEFYLQNKDKVDFYAINVGEAGSKVSSFMKSNQYSLPVLLDVDGAVSDQFQARYIPMTLVVDRNGIIQFRKVGPVTKSQLEEIVSKL